MRVIKLTDNCIIDLYARLCKDKVADASAVSVRSLHKIEDRLKSKQPDATNVKIHRATREQMITRQQIRIDDAVEVIDRSVCNTSLNIVLNQIT
jgi:hypothetical protein